MALFMQYGHNVSDVQQSSTYTTAAYCTDESACMPWCDGVRVGCGQQMVRAGTLGIMTARHNAVLCGHARVQSSKLIAFWLSLRPASRNFLLSHVLRMQFNSAIEQGIVT